MDNFFFKEDPDSKWALIFHHNSKYGYFNEKEVYLSTNPHKFSVLSRLDDSFKIDQKFEFLLLYPEIPGHAHWVQDINPLKAQPNEENGYLSISFTWNDSSTQEFHGLSLSNSTHTFLDGSPFLPTWYYSIGSYHQSSENKDAIPGPSWKYNGTIQYIVNLYIKIQNWRQMIKLYSFPTVVYKKRYFCYVFVYVFIIF